MQKLTHLSVAFLAGLLLGMNPYAVAVGGILPDIDYPIRELHRKLFHNVWFVAFVYYVLGLPFAVGSVVHLVLDSLTPMGVNWLWPIPLPRIRGLIRTGGWADDVIFVISTLAAAWFFL